MAENDVINDIFNTLNNIDVSEKVKEKNGFSYLPWVAAWTEVKKRYPHATYYIHPQVIDEFGNTRFWHDDGKSGWVEVSVTIKGETETMTLAIMDFKNKAIPADQITSVDANKAVMRCLVKALAIHGLGLYVYSGEDLPEEILKVVELQNRVTALAKKKSNISDKTREKAIELCKLAEKESNPELDDELISGKVSNIEDITILENLEKKLLAIRK